MAANPDIRPSVVYRKGELTVEDYDEAIGALQAAKTQLAPDGEGCAICWDTDHQAFECHHNPLLIARRVVEKEATWRCFHCGAVFTDPSAAEEHFGEHPDGPCECIATTHFLVVNLRRRVEELKQKLEASNVSQP